MNAHDSHIVIFVLVGLVAFQSLIIMWCRYVLVPRIREQATRMTRAEQAVAEAQALHDQIAGRR